jgi:hypothetical protein
MIEFIADLSHRRQNGTGKGDQSRVFTKRDAAFIELVSKR